MASKQPLEKIALDQVTIERRLEMLAVTHKSGMTVSVAAKQLERWALSQLRSALTMKKEPM